MSTSSTAAIVYAAVVILAFLPGIPLGVRLFGRRHAASWASGALLGYGITTLAVWTARVLSPGSAAAVILAWAFVTALFWLGFWKPSRRANEPWVVIPAWGRRDTLALALVLLLVPGLTLPAFSKINVRDHDGVQRIRAYFTADFVWHMALVEELQKGAQLPVNPYLANEPLHYYWTYLIVPAEGARLVGASAQAALEITAAGTGIFLVTMMFIGAWSVLPRHRTAVAGAVFLTVVASSGEGLASLVYVLHQTGGISAVRDLNVDAISRGVGGLRIDGLPRAFWYVPQHAMSYAVGLVALCSATAGGVSSRVPAIATAGAALALSTILNPFVGGVFCVIYAFTICADAWRISYTLGIWRHALAAVPVALALLWVFENGMVVGARRVLQFGFFEPVRYATVPAFLLSFGPLLLLLLPGVWRWRGVPLRTVAPALFGIVLSVALMHLLVVTVDVFWIGFRTGHLMLVLAPIVIARGLVALHARSPMLLASVVATALATGLPTTAIDAFNAQDVSNDHMGPGFHWTVRITPAEQEALQWIRQRTPSGAIVQMDPTARGRETWSLIPSYAGRRMAAGQPISLIHVPEYDERSVRVQRLYSSGDARQAWIIARSLGIDFVYVGPVERSAYPQTAAFAGHPEYLAPAFDNGAAAVYEVVRTPDRPGPGRESR